MNEFTVDSRAHVSIKILAHWEIVKDLNFVSKNKMKKGNEMKIIVLL